MPDQIKPTYHIAVGDTLTGSELLLAGQENYAGQRHQLAIHEYGNPDGIPVIFVHGGPGAGTSPSDTDYFDLTEYRVILVDQRGAGESTPKNGLEGNNTQNLVDDLKTICETLGLVKPLLFGGSWGSTLSLLYAIKYPETVGGLILRGIFLGEKAGIEAFFLEDSAAVKSHPNEWRDFLQVAFPDESSLQAYQSTPLAGQFELLSQALMKGIKEGNWKEIGKAYSTWEVINGLPAGDPELSEALEWCQTDDGINMGLMEIFYIINKLWLTEGYIIENCYRLKDIPIKICQGYNDYICPPAEQAFKLCTKLTAANQGSPSLVNLQVTDGGHFGSTPANKMVLSQFMQDCISEYPRRSLPSTSTMRLSSLLPKDSLLANPIPREIRADGGSLEHVDPSYC